MPRIPALSENALDEEVGQLPNWSIVDGKLHAEFKFANFVEAFAFMTKVAIEAERIDHHPEWFNVYSRVKIDLVTHEADNKISELDIELAKKIDQLA